MNRPLRENLEIAEADGAAWVQCTRCGYMLAAVPDGDWRRSCVVKQLPPASMGPHRELLEGRLVLEERYCPGCGVTLDATVVESGDAGRTAGGAQPKRQGPNAITLAAVTLGPASTAVVVLDLNVSACAPSHPAWRVFQPGGAFLDRARTAGVHAVFTVVIWDKGKPEGVVAEPLGRRADEPLLYPNGYDKFVDGELQPILQRWGAETLVFLGGSANFALLYTATTAARTYGYSVVIPLDGIYARSRYEMEYSLHQFTVLPRIQDRFRFTKLPDIEFISQA